MRSCNENGIGLRLIRQFGDRGDDDWAVVVNRAVAAFDGFAGDKFSALIGGGAYKPIGSIFLRLLDINKVMGLVARRASPGAVEPSLNHWEYLQAVASMCRIGLWRVRCPGP